ncbi:MAG: hypothetical protein QOI50_3380 [Pseudonocardiales bacterium]|jgi:hypothetical protein|nr:hypothetical protein [Pseudonocardiales bacterium]HEV7829600.1 hypothetical protein [Pseudonocardiaceae bacterium]MDT7611138.1 hypothetical protein [Pseudonocardiales bacterium]MDT7631450.1 hypothetical protein [Pseudonocardiales bacterium]MDT7639652.1 hypothetical protein [Pseudonocardiales bacterium]
MTTALHQCNPPAEQHIHPPLHWECPECIRRWGWHSLDSDGFHVEGWVKYPENEQDRENYEYAQHSRRALIIIGWAALIGFGLLALAVWSVVISLG